MLFTRILYLVNIVLCASETITYVSVERPELVYYNPKFVSYASVSSRQYSRRDPVHYYTLNFTSLFVADNNVTLDFHVYEFLTNRYKPSFVQLHYRLCDAMHKDKFFGPELRKAPALNRPCPYPPGEYILPNLTVPLAAIPRGFPFTKGRIYGNVSWASTNELMASGHIDMEMKQMKKL